MTRSKIQLSHTETELICNADIILTKNKALEKIRCLLEQSQHLMQDFALQQEWQNHPLFRNPPKISRGELYRGLPWLILDYPRIFTREHVFAIRSLFWWGHFFSSTLHISGDAQAAGGLKAAYHQLQDHSIGVNTDPWQHHFEEDNYKSIKDVPEDAWRLHLNKGAVKIARAWPLKDWAQVPELLFENWKKMLALTNCRSGEKDLSPGSPKA